MMKCKHCGAQLSEHAKFCGVCGHKVEQETEKQSQSQSTSNKDHNQGKGKEENQKKTGAKKGIIPVIPYSKNYETNQKNGNQHSEQSKNAASGDTISISKTALLGGIIAILCVALIVVSLKYLGVKKPDGSDVIEAESTTDSDAYATDAVEETTEEADDYYEYNDEFPDNVVYNSDNGHHYAVYDYTDYGLYEDFDAWEQFCEDQGGYLAVIENQAENDFIYQYLKNSGLILAFFGYTDQNSEGKWTWVNGRYSDYTNWAYGQPNNGSTTKGKKAENYAQFFKDTADGTWNDSQIAVNTYKFVCEWDY